jgi:ABC-type transporter Mla subunit MlaD
MEHLEPIPLKDPTKKDFAHNWANSSVFLFYLTVFVFVAFIVGGSFGLWAHRYKGRPEVATPSNTLYTPQYK